MFDFAIHLLALGQHHQAEPQEQPAPSVPGEFGHAFGYYPIEPNGAPDIHQPFDHLNHLFF